MAEPTASAASQVDEGFAQIEAAIRSGEIEQVAPEAAPSTGNAIGSAQQESARLERIFHESKAALSKEDKRQRIGARPQAAAAADELGPPNATDDILDEIVENQDVGMGRRRERVEEAPAERPVRRAPDPFLEEEVAPAKSDDANEKAWRAELTQKAQAIAAEKAQIDAERRDMRDASRLLLDSPIEALIAVGHSPEQLAEHFKKAGLLGLIEEQVEISKEEMENLTPLEKRLLETSQRLTKKVGALSNQLSQVGSQVSRRELAEATSVGQQRREATLSGIKGFLTKSVSSSAISNSPEAKRLLVTLSMARIGNELHKAPTDSEEQKRWAVGIVKEVARSEGLLGGKRGAAQAAASSRDRALPPMPVRSGRTLGTDEQAPTQRRVYSDPEQRKAAGLSVLARLAGEA